VKTHKGVLISVNPKVRLPRTFKRFCGLMAQLLQKLSIRATNGPDKLMKIIKGPVTKHFPLNCKRLGFSWAATKRVPIHEYVRGIDDAQVRVDGAHTRRSGEAWCQPRSLDRQGRQWRTLLQHTHTRTPTHTHAPPHTHTHAHTHARTQTVVFCVGAFAHGKIDAPWVDEEISVSEYALSAAYAIGRITNAFEQKWGIV
jgi:rRNA pseudouridine-1189 N-methylase Emg1 (Nep1/Mra1 family)